MSCLFTRRSLTPRANCLTIDADHSMTGKNQARKIEVYKEHGHVRRLTLFDFTGNVPLQVAKDKAQFIGPVLEKWIGYRNLQNATVALVDSFVEDGTPLAVCSAHRYVWYRLVRVLSARCRRQRRHCCAAVGERGARHARNPSCVEQFAGRYRRRGPRSRWE